MPAGARCPTGTWGLQSRAKVRRPGEGALRDLFVTNPFRLFAGLALLFCVARVPAGPPVPTDPRLVIDLVAREPDIVTPTGIAVDERGRVWVIENNTHERPK